MSNTMAVTGAVRERVDIESTPSLKVWPQPFATAF